MRPIALVKVSRDLIHDKEAWDGLVKSLKEGGLGDDYHVVVFECDVKDIEIKIIS